MTTTLSDTSIPAFEIAKMELRPGDIIIVKVKNGTLPEVIGRVFNSLNEVLPVGVSAILINDDIDFEIIRPS